MLKRKDLVEQFSQVVKQEIKNNGDARLATNLAINGINERITMLSAHISERLSKLENELTSQKVNINQLVLNLTQDIDKNRSCIADHEAFFKQIQHRDKQVSDSINENRLGIKESFVVLDSLLEVDKQRYKEIFKLHTLITEEIKRVNLRVIEELEKFKLEIMNLPCEVEVVKKELKDLDTRLESYTIDSDGILRELAVYKKSLFILKKELEHVNTLIGRLKSNQNRTIRI